MNPPISPTVIAQRLKQARKDARLTQGEVAENLGLARTTVVAIEKGEREARPEELVGFASLYKVALSEILKPGPSLGQVSFQFRGHIDHDGKAKLDALCRAMTEDYLYLEQLCDAPLNRRFPPEVLPGDDPVRNARLAAEDERRRLGLGLEPIGSLRSLLEERFGIRVLQFDLPDAASVSATYFYDELAGPVMCLNSSQSWRRRRLSAAHEYGHLIGSRYAAHVIGSAPEAASTRRNPSEVFSDAFQRHFLIPGGALERFVTARRRERGGMFKPSDAVELADLYGVSFEAVIRALDEDKLIKEGGAANLLAQRYEPKYEPTTEVRFGADADTDSFSRRYRRLAAMAYLKRALSEGALARYLRVDRIKAREIVLLIEAEEGYSGTEHTPEGLEP